MAVFICAQYDSVQKINMNRCSLCRKAPRCKTPSQLCSSRYLFKRLILRPSAWKSWNKLLQNVLKSHLCSNCSSCWMCLYFAGMSWILLLSKWHLWVLRGQKADLRTRKNGLQCIIASGPRTSTVPCLTEGLTWGNCHPEIKYLRCFYPPGTNCSTDCNEIWWCYSGDRCYEVTLEKKPWAHWRDWYVLSEVLVEELF